MDAPSSDISGEILKPEPREVTNEEITTSRTNGSTRFPTAFLSCCGEASKPKQNAFSKHNSRVTPQPHITVHHSDVVVISQPGSVTASNSSKKQKNIYRQATVDIDRHGNPRPRSYKWITMVVGRKTQVARV
jgi:hypothetical protein